ncbi:hypothetical protein Sfulv_47260 [Streptomyces fulvorobeus]|uniref:Hcy-binding domain-containing protein n=1 Tax=Streptomyces fulvorobeus TaxID=284028 RepID=A0A7J0CBL0_9ACTN|nr:hypothetical protein Sfulv_47260 [Streptomyces fulvorobeus]
MQPDRSSHGSAGPAQDPPDRTLGAALAAGTLLLDGGLSNQLEAQGCDLSGALWSARLLADAPHQVEAAHTAYVRAGAQVLITAGYQATFEGFERRGTGRARAAELLGAVSSWPGGPERGRGGRSGSPPRSAPTGRCSRTAASTGAGTGSPCGSWSASTGPGWRRWPRRGPTRWRWRRCRTWTRRRPC